MDFRSWIRKDSDGKTKIYERITTQGIPVRRGIRSHKNGRPYSSDPGDFGRGVYYTTNFHRARSYGDVTKSNIKLKNPLILTDEEAYALADRFETVRLSDRDYQIYRDQKSRSDKLLRNAESMTRYLLSLGHDSLVCIHKRGELEIVDYSPYSHPR